MPNYQKIISQFLSDDGTTTGTLDITGNYSVTSDTFYIQPPAGQEYVITRMIGTIEDTSGFQAEEYGNLGAALTNGMVLRIVSDSKGTQTLTQEPVKTNADWGHYMYDVQVLTWGAGNEELVFRWTFAQTGVTGIYLDGDDNARLEILAQDNLTGLLGHRYLVQGHNLSVAQ